MTKQQALEKLELEEGATASEISAQYQEFYNEFQMRITNAPTEHQRTLYKKKLDELTLAFEILGGQQAVNSTEELPGIAESIPEKREPKVASPVSEKPKMTKEKALQFLGLKEGFYKKELDKAYKSKLSACEAGRDNAIADSIREGYEEAIIQCNAAHTILKAFVFVPVIKPEPKIAPKQSAEVRTESKPSSKRKWLLPVSIFGGIGIVMVLILMNANETETKEELIDPASSKEYVALKSQADLLATQGNWEEALDKYKAVYLLSQTSEVKDSIESMKNHLLLASIENKDGSDEQKQEANEDKEKDSEGSGQEKESKPIKIGDNDAGGIVFKIGSNDDSQDSKPVVLKRSNSEIVQEMRALIPSEFYSLRHSWDDAEVPIDQSITFLNGCTIKSVMNTREVWQGSKSETRHYTFIHEIDLTEVKKIMYFEENGNYVVTFFANNELNSLKNSKKTAKQTQLESTSLHYNWAFNRSYEWTKYTRDMLAFVFKSKKDRDQFKELAQELINNCK